MLPFPFLSPFAVGQPGGRLKWARRSWAQLCREPEGPGQPVGTAPRRRLLGMLWRGHVSPQPPPADPLFFSPPSSLRSPPRASSVPPERAAGAGRGGPSGARGFGGGGVPPPPPGGRRCRWMAACPCRGTCRGPAALLLLPPDSRAGGKERENELKKN